MALHPQIQEAAGDQRQCEGQQHAQGVQHGRSGPKVADHRVDQQAHSKVHQEDRIRHLTELYERRYAGKAADAIGAHGHHQAQRRDRSHGNARAEVHGQCHACQQRHHRHPPLRLGGAGRPVGQHAKAVSTKKVQRPHVQPRHAVEQPQ